MAILHKILRGENAGQYLPYALARLRALERIYTETGFFQEKYRVPGFQIEVQQSPPYQYVRIIAEGSLYFEFQTSGNPVETQEVDLGLATFTKYKVAVVGVDVSSTASASAKIVDGVKDWFTVERPPLHRPAQIQLYDEPVAYPTADYKTHLYESFAALSPHTGPWLRSFSAPHVWSATYPFSSATRRATDKRGSIDPFLVRDIGFDIPFQYGVGKAATTRAYVRTDADWPRANAFYTAVSPTFGTRKFGVYNDSFGRFFFFPLSAIGAEITDPPYTQNIPDEMIKSVRPTMPAWVWDSPQSASDWWAASGAAAVIDFHDVDWKFSHDGTKACAVRFERRDADFDSAYFGVDQGSVPITQPMFDWYRDYATGGLAHLPVTVAPTHEPQHYSIAPGVIEVRFTVTLTGHNPQDFEVAASIIEVRRPTLYPYFTLLAGYCWHDIKATDWTEENQHYEARAGDLVVLDHEIYYSAVDHGSYMSTEQLGFLSLKNVTKVTELRTFPATQLIDNSEFYDPGGPPYNAQYAARYPLRARSTPLIDFDLPTLSFVLRINYDTLDTRSVPPLSPFVTPDTAQYETTHFGLAVFTMNRFRETLYPETITPAARAAIDALAASAGRTVMNNDATSYTLIPLNTLDGWGTAAGTFRDWWLDGAAGSGSGADAKTLTPTPSEPAFAVRAKYLGMVPPVNDIYNWTLLTEPCQGWNYYAATLHYVMQLSAHSTFFAHPNGTWAFFDNRHIYNLNGVPYPLPTAGFPPTVSGDTYSVVDLTKIEHVIFDRVHFSVPKKSGAPATKNTSFRELYNKAVAKLDPPVDGLQAAQLTDLRATFGLVPKFLGGGNYCALLRVVWAGKLGYYVEGGYQGAPTAYSQSFATANALGTKTLMLGDYFHATTDLVGRTSFDSAYPIKFSSCVLVS